MELAIIVLVLGAAFYFFLTRTAEKVDAIKKAEAREEFRKLREALKEQNTKTKQKEQEYENAKQDYNKLSDDVK